PGRAGVPGRAGNCSVHGSVGKGQPGHPELGALAVAPGGGEGRTLGAAGSSFFVECASFQALTRLSASARCPGLVTLSSWDFRSAAKVLQTPLLSAARATHL